MLLRPDLDFAGRQIQGKREQQEDFHVFEELAPDKLLVVLADGVGGHAAGELASRVAVMGFVDGFSEAYIGESQRLPNALALANRQVAHAIQANPDQRANMATTLLGVLIDKLSLHWISVGDSPLLLFRHGSLHRLNQDHSGAGQGVGHPFMRNVLFSALAGGRLPRVDWQKQASNLESGDLLIAASDGLWTLSEAEIITYLSLSGSDPAWSIAKGLLSEIEKKARPRQDNATIAVIKVGTIS